MDRLLSYLRLAGAILLCVLTFIAASAATAQSITNIASVTWQQGGQTMTAASNLVTITKVAARASIATYTGAAGGSTSLTFTPSTCIRASPSSSSNGAAEAKTTANVLQSSSIAVGGMLYFTVNAPQQNLDPNAADSIQVLLTTSSNDKETVTAYESGPNTGLFIGAVPTVPAPPAPIQGNCALSVAVGDTVTIAALPAGAAAPVATAQMSVTQDPFGYVFDSASGNAVNGTSVTLINAATGTPAQVLAADGVSSWPSTIVTGQSVTDGAGTSFTLNAGQYLFPVVAAGQYRLVVAPAPPYSAPSVATSEDLAGIVRPGGTPVEISQASYGNIFSVGAGGAVRVDVPVDRPAMRLTLSKSASRASAQAGNVIFYTVALGNPDPGARRNVVVVDKPASQLRIRPDSVRLDGAPAGPAVSFSADGHIMTVKLSSVAGSSNHILTYAAVVRTNSVPGAAPNNVAVTNSRGLSSTAAAVVRIVADQLTDRMTLVGRVTGGGCSRDGAREGIANVRLMLEDGSFAITDEDGRYHFDGLVPGDHVVAAAPMTLPPGGHFENCSRSTRNAGSASSRFVSGQGGSLLVADFYAVLPPPELAKAEQRKTGPSALRSDASLPGAAPLTSPAVLSDKAVAGADTDWLAFGDGPDGFLFPGTDQNPRSPAIRVVIRHRDGQKIELSANGKPVQTVAFDGVKHSSNHSFAVSLWSGVPLDEERTQLSATVRNRDGSTARTFTRDVYFSNVAASATLVPEQTHLVADGRRRPVIALRILDRNGRPVHRGLAGDLTISEPYESADVDTAMQQRSLSRLGRDTPHWAVTGDDGIAYVELMPTMVSGAIHLGFTFDDNGQKRQRTIDSWVVPGNIPWTLVGIAEGSVGARSIAHVMQRSGKFDSDLGSHARTAFYVKGRVLGKYLLTLAYDSTKQSADQPLAGSIDPKAYYTVYADGSSRQFDAASRSKLYVRIEARSFYGLFGDFQTGFSQTQLAHYDRVLTGVAGEATLGGVHVKAFGAKTATIERHLEIQGGGVSGPYSLGTNAIVENSETVTLQVRDRYRSNQIISSTVLTRFIDYDVDLLSGTIMFKQPVLSHDSNLDPQFIIVDFDVEPELAAADRMVGGGRADWTSPNHQLRVGATFLSTVGANAISRRARTNLVALDLKADPNSHTEIRAEVAVSRTNGVTSRAWQVEAETHTRSLDLLAYVHSTDADYGVGNTGNAELGWRKYGLDGKLRLTDHFAILSSLWDDQSLTSTTNRRALQVKAEYHFRPDRFSCRPQRL